MKMYVLSHPGPFPGSDALLLPYLLHGYDLTHHDELVGCVFEHDGFETEPGLSFLPVLLSLWPEPQGDRIQTQISPTRWRS